MKVYIITYEDNAAGNGVDNVFVDKKRAINHAMAMAGTCLKDGYKIVLDETKHSDGQILRINYGIDNDMYVWEKIAINNSEL